MVGTTLLPAAGATLGAALSLAGAALSLAGATLLLAGAMRVSLLPALLPGAARCPAGAATWGARRIHRDDHEIAHERRQIAAHQLQVMPRLDRAIGERERARTILVDDCLDQVEQQIPAHQPQHGGHIVAGDCLPGKGDDLVER